MTLNHNSGTVRLDGEGFLIEPVPLQKLVKDDPALADRFRQKYGSAFDDLLEGKQDQKGGPGSGHHGHSGIPGKRGGSAPGSSVPASIQARAKDPYIGVPSSVLEPGQEAYRVHPSPEQPSGAPIRGKAIPVDDPRIPEHVYHMTTNLPAVEKSGVLLASGAGGLGGDRADEIVSMTISKDIAFQLADDVKFTAGLADRFAESEPDIDFDGELKKWVRKSDGNPIGRSEWGRELVSTLSDQAAKEGWEFGAASDIQYTTYGMGDWLRQYFTQRESRTGTLNPIFFSDAGELLAIDVNKIGVVVIPKNNLRTGALLTDFDLGRGSLEEIRLYGDVPLADAGYFAVKQLQSNESFFDLKESDMKQITVFIEEEGSVDSKSTDSKAVNLSEAEQNIRTSFYNQFPNDTAIPIPSDNTYVLDVWDEYLVVESGGDYYRVPYTGEGKDITFADKPDWQPVEKVWVDAERGKSLSFKAKLSRAEINDLPDSSFLYIEDGGEKDGEDKTVPRSLRHLPVRDSNGAVMLPQLRNALSRLGQSSTGRTEEGKWLTNELRAKLQEKARRLLAEEQKSLEERSNLIEDIELLLDESNKQAATCVCPECGYKTEHERSKPCRETECSECGATMVGSSEVSTASGEAGRAVIAGTSSGVDSQVKDTSEDSKAGRRVRSDKVSLLQRLAKEFVDLKDALMELVGWATYEDGYEGGEVDSTSDELGEESSIDMYDLLSNADLSAALKQATEHGSSILVFPGSDGRDWLLTFTTNAFKDREDEIFTTESIKQYVSRHESDDIKGEFQFWHLPGTKFGDIRWQAMTGRFLVEAGPFDNTPTGQSFKQFFNQYPDGHPDIAPEGWGCSHKYEYKAQDREDNIYEWFDKSETTVLPSDVAANPHNPSLLKGDKTMNDRQKAALKVIGGDRLVDLVEEVGRKATAELESTVEYKAKKVDSGLPDQLQAIMDGTEDEKAKEGIASVLKAMRKMPPWLAGDGEEDEDEEEGEEEDKKPESKKEENAPEPKTESKPESEPEPETPAEEETPAAESAEVAEADKAYRQAVEQAFVAITDHVNAQLSEVNSAVKSLAEAVKKLTDEDETKIAEKAELTPAASLQEIVNSVIGHKATRVDKRSAYSTDGPLQSDPNTDGPTPVPLLNAFISGSDQKQQ